MSAPENVTPPAAANPGPTTTRASDTSYVASRWAFLPPHIREAIVTLVDAALVMHERRPDKQTRSPEESA